VIGWSVTLLSITIAAALAWRGWRVAERIARQGWEAAARTAIEAQEHRKQIEDERRSEQIILRTRGALETAAKTARASVAKGAKRPINPETMNGIIVEWSRYDRVSDDVGLLDDHALMDDVDAILTFGRLVAKKIIEDEERFRSTIREVGRKTEIGFQVDLSIITGIESHRAELLTVLVTLGDRSEEVLKRFNQKWPPQTGRAEREVVITEGEPPAGYIVVRDL
jgi:hypothetical protein